jgi:hypothetical protein
MTTLFSNGAMTHLMYSPTVDISSGTAGSVELSSALYSPDTPRYDVLRCNCRFPCGRRVDPMSRRSEAYEDQANSTFIGILHPNDSALDFDQSDIHDVAMIESPVCYRLVDSGSFSRSSAEDTNSDTQRPISVRSGLGSPLNTFQRELGPRPQCEGREQSPTFLGERQDCVGREGTREEQRGEEQYSGSARAPDKSLDSDVSCFVDVPLFDRGVTGTTFRTSYKSISKKFKQLKRQFYNRRTKSDKFLQILAII